MDDCVMAYLFSQVSFNHVHIINNNFFVCVCLFLILSSVKITTLSFSYAYFYTFYNMLRATAGW